MIKFQCKECGKTFVVDDTLAGKKAKCKNCKAIITVPEAKTTQPESPKAPATGSRKPVSVSKIQTPVTATRPASSAAPRKKPMRLRRLEADARQMQQRFASFPLIRIFNVVGDPPETYRIIYNIRGLARGHDGKPCFREEHLVEIVLTSEYPRQSPKCKSLTPVFHPNFDPATICVGDHWTAAERLSDLVIRIGEMIAYQAYNIKSPLDGEAAMWADLNQARLPIDPRSLIPPES